MSKSLLSLPALVLALALVAGAAAATRKPAPARQITKLDPRFSCAAALPVADIGAQLTGSGWSEAVTTVKGSYHIYGSGEGNDGTSLCNWSSPTGAGAGAMIVYGPGAPGWYKSMSTSAAEHGKQTCQTIASDVAKGILPASTTPDPRTCGPVTVSGIGDKAYEFAGYIGVLRGDVFFTFSVGEELINGQHVGGATIVPPTSVLETLAREILTRLPRRA